MARSEDGVAARCWLLRSQLQPVAEVDASGSALTDAHGHVEGDRRDAEDEGRAPRWIDAQCDVLGRPRQLTAPEGADTGSDDLRVLRSARRRFLTRAVVASIAEAATTVEATRRAAFTARPA